MANNNNGLNLGSYNKISSETSLGGRTWPAYQKETAPLDLFFYRIPQANTLQLWATGLQVGGRFVFFFQRQDVACPDQITTYFDPENNNALVEQGPQTWSLTCESGKVAEI